MLESHGIEGVRLIGVAKGPSRKAGLEKLVEVDGSELVLPPDHPGLHLIQHIREKAIALRSLGISSGGKRRGINRHLRESQGRPNAAAATASALWRPETDLDATPEN